MSQLMTKVDSKLRGMGGAGGRQGKNKMIMSTILLNFNKFS